VAHGVLSVDGQSCLAIAIFFVIQFKDVNDNTKIILKVLKSKSKYL